MSLTTNTPQPQKCKCGAKTQIAPINQNYIINKKNEVVPENTMFFNAGTATIRCTKCVNCKIIIMNKRWR